MRWRLIPLFGAAFLVLIATASDAKTERTTTARASEDNEKVVISNPGAASPSDATTAGPLRRVGRRGQPARPVPEHVIQRAELRNAGTPERCLDTTSLRRDTPMTGGERAEYALNANFAREFAIPACGAEPTPEAAPARIAEAFVRTIPLPLPEPTIAPDGRAITGLAAFLETNGTLTHQVEAVPTPLGPIAVEATGEYWVDWGDAGPEQGPFAFEGEAYPSGRIFHHYRWTGDYTVTLRQTWTARWRLGGDEGTVEGLVTETTTPLEVFEVQAVIRR